jgi:hypothetical protein
MSGDRKHWAYQAIAEMKQIVHDIEKAEADRE